MGGDAVLDRFKPAQQDGTIPVVEQLPRECFSISNTTESDQSSERCQQEVECSIIDKGCSADYKWPLPCVCACACLCLYNLL